MGVYVAFKWVPLAVALSIIHKAMSKIDIHVLKNGFKMVVFMLNDCGVGAKRHL